MKLQLDAPPGRNIITGYGTDYVAINEQRHTRGLVLLPDRLVTGWATGGFDALSGDDVAVLRDLAAEVVLIGTGSRQRFPALDLMRPLIEARVGYEIMDFMAACRTYNVLMAEGRLVAAALIFD